MRGAAIRHLPASISGHTWRLAAASVIAALLLLGCSGETPPPAPTVAAATAAVQTTTTPAATETARPAPTPAAPTITIAAVGDLMFARDVTTLMQQHGAAYPFERVLPLFEGADLLIGNLEGTFTDRGEPLDKYYTFRTPPALVEALTLAGFDAVSLANNHSYDFGLTGLEDTLATLAATDITSFGAGLDRARAYAPAVLGVDGITVALLGFDDIGETRFAEGDGAGVARASLTNWAEIELAATWADYVIVTFHAGAEYSPEPTIWQRALARNAIDAGADVVIGHHPHVLQPWERYNGGLIIYSLGNFVFDLDADDLATLGSGPFETAVAMITLSPDAPPAVEFRPVYIDPLENRPRPASTAEAAAITAALREVAPYSEPTLSNRAAAAERLAGNPDLLRIIDAALDGGTDGMLTLTHRHDAGCSFHGELISPCRELGLGVYDRFPGIAILQSETYFLTEQTVAERLHAVAGDGGVQIEAVWELGSTTRWNLSEFRDSEGRFAIAFTRATPPSAAEDEPAGFMLFVVPGEPSPIIALAFQTTAWNAYDTARQFVDWNMLYRRPQQ